MLKNKAIFLDRDGVINENKDDYVKNISEFKILPTVFDAIKKINESDYFTIVITNQSAIGRGLMTLDDLNLIHKNLSDLLEKNNSKIDKFYFCPHTPNDNCICRKPQPGLILDAAKEFNLNLNQSWVIGDRDSDIKAGQSAGCNTIKIENDSELLTAIQKIID